MNTVDIEIPLQEEKGKRYRFLEMLPGLISWSVFAFPFVLSIYSPKITAFFIIGYMLLWFVKAVAMNIRVLQGYRIMVQHQQLPWQRLLDDLEAGVATEHNMPDWHYENLKRVQTLKNPLNPSEVIHAVMITEYHESRDILEPTIKAVADSNFDTKKIILILAYEERGGSETERLVNELIDEYGDIFLKAFAFKHPRDIPGEVIGKGGNITFAGRQLQKQLELMKIDPNKVLLTTLDADNRPHYNYLSALTYTFCVSPDPLHTSYQPIPMFTNNIWDAPAPMRVIATGNSFWMVVQALRPHMLRNFSAHAQSMQALIETDFWSVRTIVEDGHQYWRTYFRYDSKHEVYPVMVPIYQDAVLAEGYYNTIKAQFKQIRRWAWGSSDIAYVINTGFLKKNKVPKIDLTMKLMRLLEGHISWATAPLILAFSAFIPILFNPQDIGANQLPIIASRIQRIAMIGIAITLFMSLKILPPKPKRYKAHRNLFMVLQWAYLPITTIVFSSFASINAQTRLVLGKYVSKFESTQKAVKK